VKDVGRAFSKVGDRLERDFKKLRPQAPDMPVAAAPVPGEAPKPAAVDFATRDSQAIRQAAAGSVLGGDDDALGSLPKKRSEARRMLGY
jgi:hypothetical protein